MVILYLEKQLAITIAELSLSHNFLVQDQLRETKNYMERIYGQGWNCYIADGRYWSICAHKPGSNLVFVYLGIAYGVFQTATFAEKQRDVILP